MVNHVRMLDKPIRGDKVMLAVTLQTAYGIIQAGTIVHYNTRRFNEVSVNVMGDQFTTAQKLDPKIGYSVNVKSTDLM